MQLFLFWSSELTMPPLLLSANENGVHVDEVARRLGMPRAQILYIPFPRPSYFNTCIDAYA